MQEHEKWLKRKQCGCFKQFEGKTDECCKVMGYQKECGPWIPSDQEVGTEGLGIEVLENAGPVRAGEFLAKCLAKIEAADKEQKADQGPQGRRALQTRRGRRRERRQVRQRKETVSTMDGSCVRKAKRSTMMRMARSWLCLRMSDFVSDPPPSSAGAQRFCT